MATTAKKGRDFYAILGVDKTANQVSHFIDPLRSYIVKHVAFIFRAKLNKPIESWR